MSVVKIPSPGGLPSQAGNNGLYLTTNGTVASWQQVIALPSQSGHNGQYLKTDGETASWQSLVVPVAGTDFIAFSEKGVAGGVATLNSVGQIPASQLPTTIHPMFIIGGV